MRSIAGASMVVHGGVLQEVGRKLESFGFTLAPLLAIFFSAALLPASVGPFLLF